MKRLIALLLFLVLAGGGFAAWLVFLAKPVPASDDRWVIITPGAELGAVVDSLELHGLVKSPRAFELVARTSGWGDQIKAGCYEFPEPSTDYETLRRLRAGEQTTVRVRIPAGTRRDRVARVASANMFFDSEELLHALSDSLLASEFGLEPLVLFGYMLPDTYRFYCTEPADRVVRRAKRAMDELLAAHGKPEELSWDDVVSLAAIVEWETRVDEEKARVAGVYYNRIIRRWPLQADPTIQYALIELEGGMRRLLFRDYRIQHPYNTYLFQGFPPSPITNPGRASVIAATSPEDHDYMFFVASPEGGHTFSEDLRSHNRAAERLRAYLRQRRAQRTD